MKATLTLLVLFASGFSFADDVRIDPVYIDNGVYTQKLDAYSLSEAIYNGEVDDPIVILVLEGAGTAPCTRNTPVGVYCYCNKGVRVGHPIPGWQEEDMNRSHYVRPGWHVRNLKVCTVEENFVSETVHQPQKNAHNSGQTAVRSVRPFRLI